MPILHVIHCSPLVWQLWFLEMRPGSRQKCPFGSFRGVVDLSCCLLSPVQIIVESRRFLAAFVTLCSMECRFLATLYCRAFCAISCWFMPCPVVHYTAFTASWLCCSEVLYVLPAVLAASALKSVILKMFLSKLALQNTLVKNVFSENVPLKSDFSKFSSQIWCSDNVLLKTDF